MQLSGPQQDRWERYYLLREQCYMSQVHLYSDVFALLLAPPDTPVRDVREIEVCPSRQALNWEHWVYGIELADGRKYVLDLTGIQVRLDWPLVQPWDEWKVERVSRFPGHPEPLGARRIDHERWLAEERRRRRRR
jgi:hypothetical protein